MAKSRISRMVREIQSEPSCQFFTHLFALGRIFRDREARPAAPLHAEVAVPDGVVGVELG